MTIELRICIDVDDLDRGIAFYRDALGLTLGRRLGPHWAEMLGGLSPVDLLANPAGSQPSPRVPAGRDYGRHWTPVHLDWIVPDLDAAVQRALVAGATIDGAIQEKKWGRIAVLADPFGNGFCLLEFLGHGYDAVVGT